MAARHVVGTDASRQPPARSVATTDVPCSSTPRPSTRTVDDPKGVEFHSPGRSPGNHLKQAILEVLGRDTLRAIVEGLELGDVDRRSVADMAAALSRAHRATAEAMLEFLSEVEVKAVCERYGRPSTGRRADLIKRLVRHDRRAQERRAAARETGGATTTETEPAPIARKESTKMDDPHPQPPAPPPPWVERLPDPPPGMLRVNRTELVWPGKYNDDGTRKEVPRVSLPFQVIETINESRATREAKIARHPTLFDIWEGKEGETFKDGWRNKLIWGENLLVMGSLLEKFAGKLKVVYIDPPFATGSDFSFTSQIGGEQLELTKEQSVIEEKAYRDTWGRGIESYLDVMYDRLTIIRDLLADDGSLFVHLDETMLHYVKAILDEIMPSGFRNDIVVRSTFAHADAHQFGSVHQNILFYTKSESYNFETVYAPYEQEYIDKYYRYREPDGRRWLSCSLTGAGASGGQFKWKTISPPPGRHWAFTADKLDEFERQGRIYWTKNGIPRLKQYLDEMNGMPASDVWWDKECQPLLTWTDESLNYPTQKPECLLERILKSSSHEGDLVADFFCGSGTTMAVAEKLGRRWIGCDLSRWGTHVTRKRLLQVENCKPFEILNLGRYERQYWQGVTFGSGGFSETPLAEHAIYEYFAFVLRLYRAQPVAGLAQLHGKRGRAMVHVGAVDAPVTIDEINAALAECLAVKQDELNVLGWEWEMGLYELMTAEAKRQGVKLVLLQIPREVMEQQAADKGDVQFFELAYLEVDITQTKKLTVTVTLKDFMIPNQELIDAETREKIKKWSDYVDYWAIDWDFQNDTFMQGWVTYRSRQDRTLALTSDPHTYHAPGKYRLLVKAIDIFGNDTSQAFDVEVS